MNLTKSQIELLKNIKAKLVHGDKALIADITGMSGVYVSNVLSPSCPDYNEQIVKEAVRLIAEREKETQELLRQVAD